MDERRAHFARRLTARSCQGMHRRQNVPALKRSALLANSYHARTPVEEERPSRSHCKFCGTGESVHHGARKRNDSIAWPSSPHNRTANAVTKIEFSVGDGVATEARASPSSRGEGSECLFSSGPKEKNALSADGQVSAKPPLGTKTEKKTWKRLSVAEGPSRKSFGKQIAARGNKQVIRRQR